MRIKILHVVGDSKFGGASFGILRLAKFWRSLNWEVEVLATDPEFRRTAEVEGVRVVNEEVVWREIRPWHDLYGLVQLALFIRRNQYTVVHTHTTKAGFIGRIAAWLARTPIVIHTAHGFAFHEASSKVKIVCYTFLERLASWGCKKVITVSRFHETWGKHLGIAAANKITAIPNGIPNPPCISKEEILNIRQSWGARLNQIVLFTPGRLAPEKGLEDLIEAVEILRPLWRRDMLLVIAGDGVLRPELQEMIHRKGLDDQIKLIGFQNNIPHLLASCDIAVLPTWREGLSIALLEAMSQGTAIVTTNIGSNTEATENGYCALLAPPMQPAKLAAAIEELANDGEFRDRLGARAREIYERRYTQERMLAGYHRVYLEMLKEVDDANSISPLLSSSNR